MQFRTDLALEERESGRFSLPPQAVHSREKHGCRITTMTVTEEDEPLCRKPPGFYCTIELPPMSDHVDWNDTFHTLVAGELEPLLPKEGLVLAAGLGNRAITPDALGPRTAEQILATRHLTGELSRITGQRAFRPVVSVCADVLGNTGMEALEFLTGLTRQLQPAAILLIDALAARSPGRLGCTVQLSTGGIAPGSGVQNGRPALSSAVLGVPVIALGVPTVVDATTLAMDFLSESGAPFSDAMQQEISPRGAKMIVTPREIDLLITRASRLLAMGVNTALNPCFSAEEYGQLLS